MERRERRDDAEEQRRERHQRETAEEDRSAQRALHRAERRALGRSRLDPERPRTEHDREPGKRGEDDVAAGRDRDHADDRPEQRPEHGGAHRRPDHLPAPLARGGREQPRERARPCERAAASLEEPRRGERTRSCPANAKPRLAKPISVRPTRTARREPSRAAAAPPGSPPTSAPAAYARDEHAGSRLRQVERLREVGEKRRERRVEHRVDPDEGADEKKQAAHRK